MVPNARHDFMASFRVGSSCETHLSLLQFSMSIRACITAITSKKWLISRASYRSPACHILIGPFRCFVDWLTVRRDARFFVLFFLVVLFSC